jgi:hypothetical protein
MLRTLILNSQFLICNCMIPDDTDKETQDRIEPTSTPFKFFLSAEKKFWLSVVCFAVAPLVLTYLLVGVFSFSNYILSFILKSVLFVVLLAAIGAIVLAVPSAIVWQIIQIFKLTIDREFNDGIALTMPLLSACVGVSLGILLKTNSFYPFWLTLTVLLSLLWAIGLIYFPIHRTLKIKKYRSSEQHLIKP